MNSNQPSQNKLTKALVWISMGLTGLIIAVYEVMSRKVEKKEAQLAQNKIKEIHNEAEKEVQSETLEQLVDDVNIRYPSKSSSGDPQ